MLNFYIVNQPNFASCIDFSCRLCEKAYTQGHNITVRCESVSLALALDEKLWSFKSESFIPHKRQGSIIEINRPANTTKNVLLNLSLATMSTTEGYARLMQVVPSDPNAKQAARELYKHYQQQGFAIETHNINSSIN